MLFDVALALSAAIRSRSHAVGAGERKIDEEFWGCVGNVTDFP